MHMQVSKIAMSRFTTSGFDKNLGLSKKYRPRLDCCQRSSLIRAYTVCNSMHFFGCNTALYNQTSPFLWLLLLCSNSHNDLPPLSPPPPSRTSRTSAKCIHGLRMGCCAFVNHFHYCCFFRYPIFFNFYGTHILLQ